MAICFLRYNTTSQPIEYEFVPSACYQKSAQTTGYDKEIGLHGHCGPQAYELGRVAYSILPFHLEKFIVCKTCFHVYVCRYIHLLPCSCRDQKQDIRTYSVVVVTGYLMWVLGIELRSFARAMAVLNHWAMIRVLLEKRHTCCLLIVCSCLHPLRAVE